jgi:hypothetical protein
MEKNNNLFQEGSREEILKQLEDLEKLSDDAKHNYDYLISKRNPKDLQHQILLLSLSRACKYFDGYLMLAKNGYGEPAVNLLRSIFEASLWMRWILISKENAKKYYNSSKGEAIRIAQKNIGRGLAKIKNAPDPGLMKKMLDDEARKNILPRWEDLANETGMMDMYVLVYKFMAAMCHGTFLFLGERFMNQRVSPDPDFKNIEPFIPIANNLLRDCVLVAEMWIEENKIREAPNVKELVKM